MDRELARLRTALRVKLEELSWWLGTAERAGVTEAYDPNLVLEEVRAAVTAVREAVQEVFAEDHESIFDDDLRRIGRSLDELKLLGLATESGSSSRAPRIILRDVPKSVCREIAAAADAVRSDEEARIARQDLLRAMSSGVFLDYVQRNPGKGAIKAWPSFNISETFDQLEGYPQSWTECEVFIYAADRWVIGKTFHHVEAPASSWTEYEEIPSSTAAAMLLASNAPLSVDELIELRELAASNGGPSQSPPPAVFWNRELGELKVNGSLARRVAQPHRAKQVVAVLDVFQEEGWPERVDSPFPPDEAGKQTLREAVRSLNKGLQGMRFEADGTGEGIRFRLVEEPKAPEPSSQSFDWPF